MYNFSPRRGGTSGRSSSQPLWLKHNIIWSCRLSSEHATPAEFCLLCSSGGAPQPAATPRLFCPSWWLGTTAAWEWQPHRGSASLQEDTCNGPWAHPYPGVARHTGSHHHQLHLLVLNSDLEFLYVIGSVLTRDVNYELIHWSIVD